MNSGKKLNSINKFEMDRWVGKTAVVTGVTSGIGEAIARAFASAGFHVVGLARREDRLEKLSEELASIKGSFHGIRCDLRNEDDILNAFKFVEENFNGVDVLVNNSGIIKSKDLSESTLEDIRSVLEVNFIGAALCTREAVKSIRKRGTEGHIININSVVGLNASIATTTAGIYPASKFGLRGMSQTYRKEFDRRKEQIRTTNIYPALVKTEIIKGTGHDEGVFDFVPHIQPKDISDCVVFAVSAPPNVQVEELIVGALHSEVTP